MYVQYILIIFSPMGQRQQSPLTEEQLAIVAGQRGWLMVGYPRSSGGSYTHTPMCIWAVLIRLNGLSQYILKFFKNSLIDERCL